MDWLLLVTLIAIAIFVGKSIKLVFKICMVAAILVLMFIILRYAGIDVMQFIPVR